MSYGNWVLQGGVWTKRDSHSQEVPTNRLQGMLDNKQGPLGIIKNGALKLREKNRKYDKPTDQEMKRAREEDEKIGYTDMGQLVRETKRDIEIGKIRLEGIVREESKRIVPFGSIIDDRGITHIVSQEKAEAHEEMVARLRKEKNEKMGREELTIERIERPTEGTPPPGMPTVTLEELKNRALNALKEGRDIKGRTV